MMDFSGANPTITTQPRNDADELKRHLVATLEEWLPSLLPGGQIHSGRFIVGSVSGERGQSLGIQLHGHNRGAWHDSATGQGGGVLDLIMAALGCNFHDAIARARDIADLKLPEKKINQIDKQKPNYAGIIRSIEKQLRDISPDDPAGRYLASRGLRPEGDLWFHPSMMHRPTNNSWPVMVGKVRDKNGKVTGLHRTFLHPTTPGKARVEEPKMMLGDCKGGSVWLGRPESGGICVCEGIETGLAAQQIFKLPVWAALTTTGLCHVQIVGSVETVVILADNDQVDPKTGKRPGQHAAETLAIRLVKDGLKVSIVYPKPQFKDFNDELQGHKSG